MIGERRGSLVLEAAPACCRFLCDR